MSSRFLQQLHLQLRTNMFASSFLDVSLILHRETGPDIIAFSPSFVLQKNATTVNIQTCFLFFLFFSHCERQDLFKATLFSLSWLFLAHGGSSLSPSPLANNVSEGRMYVHYDTIKGERDFFFFFFF